MAEAVCYERSLVVWANTFFRSDDLNMAPADSITDFTSGDLIVPIARAILGHPLDTGNEGGDVGKGGDLDTSTVGWKHVLSMMQPAGLLEYEDIHVFCTETWELRHKEDGPKMAVTCLETLLRHTVTEDCPGRETFIRQIMSLDNPTQCTLSCIIVGSPVESSEAGSPSRESVCSASFTVSPAPSSMTPTPARRRFTLGDGNGDAISSPYQNISNWFSPTSGNKGSDSQVVGVSVGAITPVKPDGNHPRVELDTEGMTSGMRSSQRGAASTAVGRSGLPVEVDANVKCVCAT